MEDSDEDDDSSVVIVDDTEGPGSDKEGGEQESPQHNAQESEELGSVQTVDGDDRRQSVTGEVAPPGDDQVSRDDEAGGATVHVEERHVPTCTPDVPTPAPRRSSRVRQPPVWQRSGEFVMSQVCPGISTDWMSRAEYLQGLVQQGVLSKDRASDALVKIVCGNGVS